MYVHVRMLFVAWIWIEQGVNSVFWRRAMSYNSLTRVSFDLTEHAQFLKQILHCVSISIGFNQSSCLHCPPSTIISGDSIISILGGKIGRAQRKAWFHSRCSIVDICERKILFPINTDIRWQCALCILYVHATIHVYHKTKQFVKMLDNIKSV